MPAMRIAEFDVWRAGYSDVIVTVNVAGTSTPASLYTDEALTTAADNPQTLISRQDGDTLYGKFQAPLYTNQAYTLSIGSTDITGIQRPGLLTLDAEDASLATVIRAAGNVSVTFEDVIARTVHVRDFGEFLPTSDPDASGATNNQTLEDAIAAASSGGFVDIPAGTFSFTGVTLPAGVVLRGQGEDVTILQSQTAAEVITPDGDACGLRDLTVDGVSLVALSCGFFVKNKNRSVLENVRIKRFSVGLYCKGAHGSRWRNLTLDGCTNNAQLHGNTNGDASGNVFTDNEWTGRCINAVTLGLDLEYIDAIVAHNRFSVGFEDNAVTAVKIRGARYTDFAGSWWTNNAKNFDVDDFVTGTFADDNTVLGLWVRDFRMADGNITLKGDLGDTCFERGLLNGNITITITTPGDAVCVKDVVEGDAVTISGDGTKWLRSSTNERGASSGITTNNTATKAWSVELDPGQRCLLVGRVIGNSKTTDESGEYYIAVSARRPPSTLNYDTQTANFTTGRTVTGGTSGATALIVTDTDGGATGTLELRNIIGAFVDNEIITDSSTGSATANGTLTAVDAELLGAVTSLRTAREDAAGWNAVFVANGPEIELQVTGENSKTIEWLVDVDMTRT